MQYLREEGTDTIRPFSDSELEVTRRWYRAADEAPWLPFPTVFRSTNWEPFPYLRAGAGSVWPAGWSHQRVGEVQGFDYAHFCGTESDFNGGATFDPDLNVTYDDEWIPDCCGRLSVCVTQLCSQDQENARPAAQLRSYPIPHQDATDTTPVVVTHWPTRAVPGDPSFPGFGYEWFPVGEVGARAVAHQVVADDLGDLQYQVDTWSFGALDTIARTVGPNGFSWDLALGGDVGSMTLEFVAGVLTLSGVNFAVDALFPGLGTAAYEDVGQSGHTVPFLDGVNTWTFAQFFEERVGNTTDANQVASFTIKTTGTPAVGFGGSIGYYAEVTGGGTQPCGADYFTWTNPVVLSQVARRSFTVRGPNQEREYMRAEAPGDVERIGFLGADAVPRQSGDVAAALVALGLMSSADYTQPAALADLVALGAGADLVAGDGAGGYVPVTIGAHLSYSSGTLAAVPPTATAGQVVCTTFIITAGSATYQATGNTFTLPAAGTYLVTGRIRGDVQPAAAGGHYVSAKLRNNTAGADLASSETLVATSGTSGIYAGGTGSFTALVTVAGPSTFELYAQRVGSSFTLSQITSDTNGRTVFDYVRLF